MNTFSLWSQLSENALRGSILILALCVLRSWARRYLGASAFQWVWILVAVRLLLPVELPSLIEISTPDVPIHAVRLAEDASRSDGGSGSASTAHQSPAAAPVAFAAWWPFGLWLSGVIAFATTSGIGSLRFWRRVNRSSRPAAAPVLRGLAEICFRLGMPLPRVFETALVNSPAVAGLIRPMILIPHGLCERLSQRELETVLLHELGHLKRGDLWRQAILRAAVAVHWFNPLVWIAAGLARADRELACDEFVLANASPEEAANYDRTLLNLVQFSRPGARHSASAGILETLKDLKYRIHSIHGYRPKSVTRSVISSLFLIGAATVTLSASLKAGPGKESAESPSGKSSPVLVEIKIIQLRGEEAERLLQTRGHSSLNEADAAALMEDLVRSGKIDVLSAPKIVSLVGQAATVEVGSDVTYRAEKPKSGKPEERKAQKVGLTTRVLVESLSPAGDAKLAIQFEQTEIRGWQFVDGAKAGSVVVQSNPPGEEPVKPLLKQHTLKTEVAMPLNAWTLIPGGAGTPEETALWLMVAVRPAEQASGEPAPARADNGKR